MYICTHTLVTSVVMCNKHHLSAGYSHLYIQLLAAMTTAICTLQVFFVRVYNTPNLDSFFIHNL